MATEVGQQPSVKALVGNSHPKQQNAGYRSFAPARRSRLATVCADKNAQRKLIIVEGKCVLSNGAKPLYRTSNISLDPANHPEGQK